MATVYLAHDLRNNRPVALKVLRPELAAILGAERFLKEIETTANLQHPHILPLFDSGQARTFLFYVMPFNEGESLRDRLNREKQLPIADAVRIATEVASALDYAHRHNVLHRDIKPENILLHDGQALVADFGIALAMRKAGGARLTETGLSLGTPQYMSPEQATAERELDARTDIYALGAVTYEMLTGEPPFTGATTQSVIAKLMTEAPRPPSVLRKAVPLAVEGAVLTALEKLPADRFASAAQFAEALTDPATTRAVRTPPQPVAGPTGHWRTIALGAVTVAVAAGALTAWGWLRPSPPRPVSRYRLGLPTEQASGMSDFTCICLALSPDGARMVYVGTAEKANQLWIRDRDRLEGTLLAGTGQAASPFFSPDGRQIGFFRTTITSAELKVMPAAGGPAVTLGVSSSAGGAWSTDGWIYFDSPSGYKRIPAAGGTPELVVPLDSAHKEQGLAWPDVLPGGKGLLLRSRRNLNSEDFDLVAVNLETGRRQVLGKGVLARYLAPEYLLMVRADGALLAAGFDRQRLSLTGPAVPILEGIRVKDFGSVDLAVSQEGTLVYGAGEGTAAARIEAVWVERDGSVQSLNPPLHLTPAPQRGLALSPDGALLALDVKGDKSTDIWIRQLPSGALSRLTFEGATNMRPSWAPDGRSVIFVSDRGPAAPAAVWRQRADGSQPAEPVRTGTTHDIRAAAMSPVGEWLVYHELSDSGWDIRAIRPGHDTSSIPLLTRGYSEVAPSLSPDGKWLAYTSDESGREEVYVRPFPRVGDGRWQVSAEGGTAPRWAHSGRELYYQAGGTNAMMAVSVTLAPRFMAGASRKLFDAIPRLYPSNVVPYYDVTPDDRRFIMARLVSTDQKPGPAQLIVVENFREEVRRKLKAADISRAPPYERVND